MRKKKDTTWNTAAIVILCLLLVGFTTAEFVSEDEEDLRLEVQGTATENSAYFYEEEKLTLSEIRYDFEAIANGRAQYAVFNISVILTNATVYDVGQFAVKLRQIEYINPHDAKTENYIDYIVPAHWNTTQVLSETVEFMETTRQPIRAMIANEPLFLRGTDYPEEVPFDEIEIQVDLVKFYTDTNQTAYVTWVRIFESEEASDLKEIRIVPLVQQ